MTGVSITYILMVQEGFRLPQTLSYLIGTIAAAVLFVAYLVVLTYKNRGRSSGE